MTHAYIVKNTERMADILLLTLQPSQGARVFDFVPGQYATMGFVRGGRPTAMRCFSIVSAPGAGYLQFAMRVRGNFTQAATALQMGDTVRVQGPFGDFTVDQSYDNQIVMLAAGIGITPFVSMLRDATARQLNTPITLLFSNRSAANIPFYDELRSMERQNPNLHIRFFVSDGTSPPAGEDFVESTITDAYVAQLAAGKYRGSTYFVCGPKGFSGAMRAALRSRAVHQSRIVSESFVQTASVTLSSGIGLRPLTYSLAALSLLLAIGFITTLDLSRTVPKLASAQAAAAAQSTTTTTQPQPSDDSNDSSPTATTPQATSAQPAQPTYQYQPPVSSVS